MPFRKTVQKIVFYLFPSNFHFLPKAYKVGERIEICEIVGAGGYAKVYKGIVDGNEQKKVLVKQLRKHLFLFYKTKHLLQETTFPKLLNSNVEESFHINQDGHTFLILPFKEGKSLEEYVFNEGKVYSLKESLQLFRKIMEEVIVIHEKNIIHHDLRLPNILVHNEEVSIIDFGLAEYIVNEPLSDKHLLPDYFKLGHVLLFLLYTNYSASDGKKAKTWEEELQIPSVVKDFIRKLLLLDTPFTSDKEMKKQLNELVAEICSD